MKALRERDLADARNRSASAGRALEDLERMVAEGSTVARLFPDLLAGHMQDTLSEKAAADRQVRESGDRVVKENRKLEVIEERYHQQRRSDENKAEEVERSEVLDQRVAGLLSASSKFGRIG